MDQDLFSPQVPAAAPDFSVLLIGLLKGVQYREQDESQWASLLNLQARVRDQVARAQPRTGLG